MNKFLLEIEQDDCHDDGPRDWDNIGTMVCWHPRYTLGDLQLPRDEDPNEFLAQIDTAVVLPLYLFDHSGLSMSTSDANFKAADSYGWDWGVVGFIYCTKQQVIDEYLDYSETLEEATERAKKYMIGEVETYDQYLRGDVWGYVIKDDCDDVLESCWGFYGYENAVEEGKAMLGHIERAAQEAQDTEDAERACQCS